MEQATAAYEAGDASLENWAENKKGLLLKGPRQVGKTFILKLLGEKKFTNTLFVNLRSKEVCEWFEINCAQNLRDDKWADIFTRFASVYGQLFFDDARNLVILDEIQSSPRIFGAMRDMVRNGKFKVAATGSYLGMMDIENHFSPNGQNFFYAAGDVQLMEMHTMTYREVITAAKEAGIFDLAEIYRYYVSLGGFPEVVENWLENRQTAPCVLTLEHIYSILVSESQRYFEGPFPADAWTDTLVSVIAQIETKKAVPVTEEIVFKFRTANGLTVGRNETVDSMRWMISCNLLFLGDVTNNLKSLDRVKYNYYFEDQGLMSLVMNKAINSGPVKFNRGNMLGLLAENFTALSIREFMRPRTYSKNNPKEEIDFIAERTGFGLVGIEVKHSTEMTKSGDRAMERKDIRQIIKLEGQPGQSTNEIISLPIWEAHTLGALLGYPENRHKYNKDYSFWEDILMK
jgi:predicted AAA+ superfamily ATPase